MELIQEVKKDLRINHDKLDESISADIEFSIELIKTAGVRPDTSDPLVKRAIKNYLRFLHNFNGEADRYKAAFDELLKTMCLSCERRLDYEE